MGSPIILVDRVQCNNAHQMIRTPWDALGKNRAIKRNKKRYNVEKNLINGENVTEQETIQIVQID
jgi:hypothetical protein